MPALRRRTASPAKLPVLEGFSPSVAPIGSDVQATCRYQSEGSGGAVCQKVKNPMSRAIIWAISSSIEVPVPFVSRLTRRAKNFGHLTPATADQPHFEDETIRELIRVVTQSFQRDAGGRPVGAVERFNERSRKRRGGLRHALDHIGPEEGVLLDLRVLSADSFQVVAHAAHLR